MSSVFLTSRVTPKVTHILLLLPLIFLSIRAMNPVIRMQAPALQTNIYALLQGYGLEEVLGEVSDSEGNNDAQHPLHFAEFNVNH